MAKWRVVWVALGFALIAIVALLGSAPLWATPAFAQAKKDSAVLAMTLATCREADARAPRRMQFSVARP